ncbi:hypothetical protein [Aquicoccus sp.]|uniref:hypothetical protein n=1 Tax=Aquicoccus sp. TaxID=2055851 RepID=UPI0035636F45
MPEISLNPLICNWTGRKEYACCPGNPLTETSYDPETPENTVTLTGHDGNAFTVLGRCRQAAREAGLADDEIATFTTEATAGDYDHLLQTVMRWFDIHEIIRWPGLSSDDNLPRKAVQPHP